MNEKELIRHFIATIYYRGMKYLSVDDVNFNSLVPDNSIRTPAQILNHINGLLLYIQSFFIDVSDTYPEELSFKDEVDRFKTNLKRIDDDIASNELNHGMTYRQLLQGPLSDIMLHIGELSMLRKISGRRADDVENYIAAEIELGVFN